VTELQSADPTGGAHDAPPDPLVGWGWGTPPRQEPHPPRRLRRLVSNVYPPIFLSIHHWTKGGWLSSYSCTVGRGNRAANWLMPALVKLHYCTLHFAVK